jgi:glycosyltransferase involved in cell wall biosynthesis
MRNVEPDARRSVTHRPPGSALDDSRVAEDRPLVSVVIPAYNEADILVPNLTRIWNYLDGIREMFRWEVVVVNDGSTDATGALADAFAAGHQNVRVLHHHTNFRLGQALRYAFSNCHGDYVVTMDCDLSYGPEHIAQLLTALRSSNAKVVIASPYAKNGQTTKIPFLRRFLSRSANRFLAATAKGHLSTLTGMVRAYDRRFLSTLDLRSMGTDINTEILYKAELLGAKVVEIPAHLDWTFSQSGGRRRSSIGALANSTNGYLLSGFMFRPVLFFIGPGLLVLAAAIYTLAWVSYHVAGYYLQETSGSFSAKITNAIRFAYDAAPYSFVVGGIALIIAIQLLSLGTLALQSERYFKELFHFNTTLYRHLKQLTGASAEGPGTTDGQRNSSGGSRDGRD